MICLTLAVLLSAAPAADTAEPVRAAVRAEFDRVGRSYPTADPALDQAAQALANKALATSAAEAADLLFLTAQLSKAGGFDATPKALLFRSSPADEALKSLKARRDLASEPVTHFGAGYAQQGDRSAICVLLAERRAEVEKFPRQLPSESPAQRLCATLKDGYQSADLFVTRPDGVVDKRATTHTGGGQRVCAEVSFSGDGRYTIELLARGDQGPQVVALFFVQVGKAKGDDAAASFKEPRDPAEAKDKLAEAINNLRHGSGLSTLKRDAELDGIAQPYAQRMASENFFAHVAPDGQDLKARLRGAGYHFASAGENLGLASGPLAAHFSIEHSPGHRKNLLEPGYTRLGLGVAKNAQGQAIVVEVLATPAEGGTEVDPFDAAYEALDRYRVKHHLPSMKRTELLEKLATAHARRALELDKPTAKLPGENLHERIFAARDDIDSAAVDVYVVEDPSAIADSKNLAQASNELVGVGLAEGDSLTYGPHRFFVVVVYAHVKH